MNVAEFCAWVVVALFWLFRVAVLAGMVAIVICIVKLVITLALEPTRAPGKLSQCLPDVGRRRIPADEVRRAVLSDSVGESQGNAHDVDGRAVLS